MIITHTLNYPAYTGDEVRLLYIYLPVDYDFEPERHYPVLYMFDGHNVFYDEDATYGKSWGLADYLDFTETPLIVASIECHHGSNGERIREYSPFDFYDHEFGSVTGYGEDTMRYYIDELKPEIDANFRTIPDREHTFIAGSSMGGLMSLYAVFRHNDVFSKAAALSPTIFPCYKKVCQMIRKTPVQPGTTIYTDLGTEEMTMEGGSAKGFAKYGKLMFERGIAVTQRIVPGGTHSEASWEQQIPIFMNVLMYGLEEYEPRHEHEYFDEGGHEYDDSHDADHGFDDYHENDHGFDDYHEDDHGFDDFHEADYGYEN